MTLSSSKRYLYNCFLLTLPILIWNIILANKLPEAFQAEVFWHNIPLVLVYAENTSRMGVFIMAILMPLGIERSVQKQGLWVYLSGTLIYFMSWLVLIFFPHSVWSTSLPGFMAPAYTPLVWLTGIGLIGDSFYVNLPYHRWYFIGLSIIFLACHNLHTCIIYYRLH